MDISSSTIKWHDWKLLNQTGPNADRQPFADLSPHPTIRSINLPPGCKVIHHNINHKLVVYTLCLLPVVLISMELYLCCLL